MLTISSGNGNKRRLGVDVCDLKSRKGPSLFLLFFFLTLNIIRYNPFQSVQRQCLVTLIVTDSDDDDDEDDDDDDDG